jgi:hypothetical protein
MDAVMQNEIAVELARHIAWEFATDFRCKPMPSAA